MRYIFTVLTAFISFSISPDFASDKAMKVTNAVDTLRKWTADQHLYIKGDTGVAQSQLDGLEQWLDKNAPNWTVVIFDNASDEVWGPEPEDELDSRSDLDEGAYAVKQRFEEELKLSEKYKALIDNRCNRENGIIIFIDQSNRRHFIIHSEMQSSTIDTFKVELKIGSKYFGAYSSDAPILERLKSLIPIYNKRVEKAFLIQKKEQQWIKPIITPHLIKIDQMEEKAKQLRAEYPDAKGKILFPPFEQFRNDLNNIAINPHRHTYQGTKITQTIVERALNEVLREIISAKNKIKYWEKDRSTILEIENRLKKYENLTYNEDIDEKVKNTLVNLSLAKAKHAAGDISYKSILYDCNHDYRYVRGLYESREKYARRDTMYKVISISLSILFTGAFLFYRYKKTQPHRQQAVSLLLEWETAIKTRTEWLFQMMDKVVSEIGYESEFEQRGYRGTDLSRATEIVRSIDKAFVLSSHVHLELQEIQNLIYPSNIFGKAKNFLTKFSYEEAIEMLESRPIRYKNGAFLINDDTQNKRSLLSIHYEQYFEEATFNEYKIVFDQALADIQNTINRMR
mgnify:CR=1 FL=1